MSNEFRAIFTWFSNPNTSAGKVSIIAAVGCSVFALLAFVSMYEIHVPQVSADDVQTSVNVLNTPPDWTVVAQERIESSAANPTNIGTSTIWHATATDSSGDSYFLLICKSSTTPTAVANGPPQCGGGISQRWAISATTTSGAEATAATTTVETATFAQENNSWAAWVCDSNSSLPRCNPTYEAGSGNFATPFVVNHPPIFSLIVNDGPEDPGGTVTWTATAYDNDLEGGADTVRLFVCQTNSFNGSACGAAGWATSTLVSSNPATTTPIIIPTQDALYAAYVFVSDSHFRAATSTVQGTNSSFTVNNVAPSISAATISLETSTSSSGNIVLTVPASTSGPFYVKFTATDNNSCQSIAGAEMTTTTINVYRSGIASAGCDTLGEYSANNCYTASSTQFSRFLTCTQDGASCSGITDSSTTWTCSFPLWYTADPTDGAALTPWSAENWLANVMIFDDDWATSTKTEGISGNEIASFLAFDVTQTSIGYGDLQPGQFNDPLASTTNLIAQGNIGLDEDLYGDTMCTSWSAPDSCDINGVSALNDIPVNNQKFASSSVAYASAFAYPLTGSSSPTTLAIRVPKTTATSSPNSRNTYWGINIPGTITQAGNYFGQNTITAKRSAIAFW